MFAANYFFNPKFKLRRWDGKIRYFHKTGKTFVKLLDEIIPKVISLGYRISIDDRRIPMNVTPAPITEDFFSFVPDSIDVTKSWKIRDYQLTLIQALFDNAGGVAIAGTGSGKTSCCAAIAKSYEIAGNLKSIIVVPDKNLTRQTIKEYIKFGLDVGEYSGTKKDLSHQHTVSTWQALKNSPELIQQFQVIIVDECQGLKGNVLTKLLNEYGNRIPYRFGVTGTLPKDESDAMAVKVAVGTVQCIIPAHELIEKNVLSDLTITIHQNEMDLTREYEDYLTQLTMLDVKVSYKAFKESYFEEWPHEKKFLQRDEDRVDWIVNFLNDIRSNAKGNTLCLVNGVDFGKKLHKLIPDSIFIHGEVDDMDERDDAYETFNTRNDTLVFATVQIASTGLNIPRIFNLVYIDIGKSFIRVIQSIGRGLRKALDKDFVNIHDISSDLKFSKRHLRQRIKYYKEAKYPHTKEVISHKKVEIC